MVSQSIKKKVKKGVATGGLVVTLATNLPFNVLAEPLNLEEILSNVQVISVQTTTPSTPTTDLSTKPVTWGDFLAKSKASVKVSDQSLEFVVKDSKAKDSLVMTKTEVYESFKLLLEITKQSLLNESSSVRLMRLIHSLAPTRNYLNKGELDNLFARFNNLQVNKGVLREGLVARVLEISGDYLKLEVFPENSEELSTTEYYRIAKGTPWKYTNNVYEVIVEGNEVVSLTPKYELLYGVVTDSSEGLTVDGKPLPTNKGVLAGNYVEYVVKDSQPYVLANLGTPTYYILSEADNDRIYTLEDKDLKGNVKVVDYKGKSLDPRTLPKHTLLTKLKGNLVLASSQAKSSEINYQKKDGLVYVDGVIHQDKNVWVSDGTKAEKMRDYPYIQYVTKANVVSDLTGTPRLLKVDRVEKVVAVTDSNHDGKIKGVGESGTVEYERKWGTDIGKVRSGRVYTMVVIDKEVVEATPLPYEKVRTRRLRDDYIDVGRKKDRLYLDDDTLALVTDGSQDDWESYRRLSYKELKEEYEDKINRGDMTIKVYYDEDKLLEVRYNERD